MNSWSGTHSCGWHQALAWLLYSKMTEKAMASQNTKLVMGWLATARPIATRRIGPAPIHQVTSRLVLSPPPLLLTSAGCCSKRRAAAAAFLTFWRLRQQQLLLQSTKNKQEERR